MQNLRKLVLFLLTQLMQKIHHLWVHKWKIVWVKTMLVELSNAGIRCSISLLAMKGLQFHQELPTEIIKGMNELGSARNGFESLWPIKSDWNYHLNKPNKCRYGTSIPLGSIRGLLKFVIWLLGGAPNLCNSVLANSMTNPKLFRLCSFINKKVTC